MTLELFGHPFSSYTQKVLIALWANGTDFDYRMVEDPGVMEELRRHSPFGLFPLLLDNGQPVIESTPIIEHLQAHYPGANVWIREGEAGRRTRLLDRFFDLYVMGQMQVPVADKLRPDGMQDPFGVKRARERLHIAYDWLEGEIGEPFAIGEPFTLADCAAAPSLFYADWVEEIGESRPRLKAYRARLLQHPTVARAIDVGRPFRDFFPLGAPVRY